MPSRADRQALIDIRDHAGVERTLDRLHGLYPRLIDLSLDRLLGLLDQLGQPHTRLPPVIHVAGTNGKGSTCAMIRAVAEATALRVHVYTSPHLVRFNERIRLAGRLVDDATLQAALETVEAANEGRPITVFEVITAAALHLFAETPADLCVLEVGLGGRGDATNVVSRPAACAITSISIDHAEFLGDTLAAIATEKAGIARPGVPLVTGAQPAPALNAIRAAAETAGAWLRARDEAWSIAPRGPGLRYEDGAGVLDLPAPGLPGAHQVDNAGIAVASLRAAAQHLPGLADRAFAGIEAARWPARLQRLTGRLAAALPCAELWLDGGHNPGAGEALAAQAAAWSDQPLDLVIGLKDGKDAATFLAPLLPRARAVFAVREPGQHQGMTPEAVVEASGGLARIGPTVADALAVLARAAPPGRVLICGSLYLAGEVLKADGAMID